MYAGHFAAGLAQKGRVPSTPTWGILLDVGVLDILFGPLVLAGIEQVSITPEQSPGFFCTSLVGLATHAFSTLPSP